MHGACRLSLQELLAAELRLDPRQWGPAPRRHPTERDGDSCGASAATARKEEALLEIDCLVSGL